MLTAKFRIQAEALPLIEGYDRLSRLVEALDNVIPVGAWHRLPRTEDEGSSGWIPLSSRDDYLRRVARDLGEDAERWPGTGEGFSTVVTTARNVATWDSEERAVLKYSPRQGVITLEWLLEEESASAEFERTRQAFLAICNEVEVLFACSDRPASPRPSGKPGRTYFGIDYRVFPHREFLGWMGFVPKDIDSHEIPEADELIPVLAKRGTMVVAVGDRFAVHNHAHIEKAQRVEMRLVDLDALPVTDPRFL